MPHDVTLIATMAAGLAFAFLGGLLAVRLRLPSLLGYLLAGIVVGPFTPGYVADTKLAGQLAEIGVMLMMFGVSFALGAFFAGMVVNASDHNERAATELQPLQDAFTVLFFVSVGMLFNPAILVEQPVPVLVTVAIIIVGKTLAAFLIVLAFQHPPHTAIPIAAALAQTGEFSFILAALGLSLGLLSSEGQNLILAGAIVSITLNPVVFRLADAARRGDEDGKLGAPTRPRGSALSTWNGCRPAREGREGLRPPARVGRPTSSRVPPQT